MNEQEIFLVLNKYFEFYRDRYHRVVVNLHEFVLDEFYTEKSLSNEALDLVDRWEAYRKANFEDESG